MKKLLLLASAFTLFILFSCKKDSDSAPTTENVSSTVKQGNWRITLHTKNGTDNTSSYNGFKFTFNADGSLVAANDLFAIPGTWAVIVDSDKVKLKLFFNSSAPSNMLELVEDWEVLERTSVKIRMQHISGGSGTASYLTIEKN